MVRKTQAVKAEKLAEYIADAMLDKKGLEVVRLNFSKIHNAFCDFFVICHGTSRVHVETIAESVEAMVSKKTGNKPLHREGRENAEWILLDYIDVVVHVFQDSTRNFYKLENLWADAEVKRYGVAD